MSSDAKKRLEILGLVIAILTAAWGAIASSVLLPYRMTAAEVQIDQIQRERKTDHELLTRIDERTAVTQRTLDKMADKLAK